MALPFNQVHDRKLAIAKSLGYGPSEVAEFGITEEYIAVLTAAYARVKAPAGRMEVLQDSPVVRVHWATREEMDAAAKAIKGDWDETLSLLHP